VALEQRLNLRLQQRLVMTPTLQQAIKLLQLSKLELQDQIAAELVENPVLEEQDEADAEAEAVQEAAVEGAMEAPGVAPSADEPEQAPTTADAHDAIDEIDLEAYFREPFESSSVPNMSEHRELPSIENTPAATPALAEHLLWQLGMQIHDRRLVPVGKVIIGNLDTDGHLQATDEEILETLTSLAEDDPEIACQEPYVAADVERARRKISHFDPVGVACRSLEQCLLTQLEHVGLAEGPIVEVVSHHLELLRRHAYAELARKVGIDEARAREIAAVIRGLNPRPGSGYGGDRSHAVIPDVVVVKVDGEYKVLLNDEGMPRLRISPLYRRLLERVRAAREAGLTPEAAAPGEGTDRATRDYVREKFRSAVWFIKSLDQRQQTIFKVASSIVKHQRGFLDHGIEALRPLVLRDVAEDVKMHESTVSRVVTNKYIHTPRGLFEMKFFFHSGLATGTGDNISSLAVKQRIKELIDREAASRPLSDSAIVKTLQGQGIEIARRTVAKYRDELGIASSAQRKRA
jgi:RNA polymerase sigma-54 factor